MLKIDAINAMTIPAGDALELRYQELDDAGAIVSLAGAETYLVLSDRDGAPISGAVVLGRWDAGEKLLAWSIPGSVTAALSEVGGLTWELRAVGPHGFDQWDRGAFYSVASAGLSGVVGDTPPGEALIQARQVASGWRIVVSHRGARGLSAAEQLHAAGIIPDPTAQALDAYLRALVAVAVAAS